MEVVGWTAVAVIAVVVAAGVVVGLVNLPDARRYMKMRRM
ncbi:DUF6893 family small protein [Mycobacterium sp.]|jgi:hypothetical protein